MSDPIEPTAAVRADRRGKDRRASKRRDGEGADKRQTGSNLPVPVGPSRRAAADPEPTAESGAAIFTAQLLGQDGQKRGLRGGQPVLDSARSAYLEAEWSGRDDRRIRAGRITKTKI